MLAPIHSLGPGERVCLWVQGCGRGCPGCISPELQPRFGRQTDEGLARRAGKLLRGRALNGDEAALLDALRPFLSEERRLRLDRALKLARLAALANLAGELGIFGGDGLEQV